MAGKICERVELHPNQLLHPLPDKETCGRVELLLAVAGLSLFAFSADVGSDWGVETKSFPETSITVPRVTSRTKSSRAHLEIKRYISPSSEAFLDQLYLRVHLFHDLPKVGGAQWLD